MCEDLLATTKRHQEGSVLSEADAANTFGKMIGTHMCTLVHKHVFNLGIHTHRNQHTTQTHTYVDTHAQTFYLSFPKAVEKAKG